MKIKKLTTITVLYYLVQAIPVYAGTSQEDSSVQAEKNHFAIKGLYIDMPIDEACNVINNNSSVLNVKCQVIDSETEKEKRLESLRLTAEKNTNSWFRHQYEFANRDYLAYKKEGIKKPEYYTLFCQEIISPPEQKYMFRSFPEIKADYDTKLVREITMHMDIVDKLFNTEDMTAQEFVQAIVDNYHIPSMDYFSDGSLDWYADDMYNKWGYSSPDGYRLIILNFNSNKYNKTLKLKRITKASSRKFD